MSDVKFRTRARRGHGRWFIERTDSRPRVQCLCGEVFSGFVAWSRHAFVDPVSARGSVPPNEADE